MKSITRAFGLAVVSICLLTSFNSYGILEVMVTNRYDWEATSGSVTEAGWTHIDPTIAYTATTAGFHLGGVSSFLGGFNRPPSIQPPTDVTRDVIIGYGKTSNVPTIVFRDIVPAHSTNVALTIYRSDSGDNWQANFTTSVRYNGGSEIVIDTGDAINGSIFYHVPIIANLALDPQTNAVPLDFYFYDNVSVGNSQVRVNGIEAIYTIPEPTAIALLMCGVGAFLVCRRRRSAVD